MTIPAIILIIALVLLVTGYSSAALLVALIGLAVVVVT